MNVSAELKSLAYVRKHPSARGWHTVAVKVPTDENVHRVWTLLAGEAAEVKPASYSLRFARFA